MNPPDQPTPRTDAMLNGCEWGNRQDQAHTALCRTLERELAAAKEECERLRPHSLSSGEREDYHDALTELTRLRAEVERLDGCCDELHTVIDNAGYPSGKDYAAMTARAEKAEAELAAAVDGVINGGDCRENILYINVPYEPRGHMVGQPVKVILPAINAAMKGTP